jgi:hypothetical protein
MGFSDWWICLHGSCLPSYGAAGNSYAPCTRGVRSYASVACTRVQNCSDVFFKFKDETRKSHYCVCGYIFFIFLCSCRLTMTRVSTGLLKGLRRVMEQQRISTGRYLAQCYSQVSPNIGTWKLWSLIILYDIYIYTDVQDILNLSLCSFLQTITSLEFYCIFFRFWWEGWYGIWW